MAFDPTVQQQLMLLAMQDPQTFQQISQNATNIASAQNWNRPVMTPNYGASAAIRGRMITDPKEIRPNEVAQDGIWSYFPTNDYSAIYAKAWNTNGGIDTVKYVLDKSELEPQGPSEFDQVMARLDKLEHAITQSYQHRQNNYQNNRNRRGNEGVNSNDESQRNDS